MKKTIIVCDNCGSYIEKAEDVIRVTVTPVHRDRLKLRGDLCETCADSLPTLPPWKR